LYGIGALRSGEGIGTIADPHSVASRQSRQDGTGINDGNDYEETSDGLDPRAVDRVLETPRM